MANLINEIIKETIKEAAVSHLTLTPDNYHNIFCKIAKKRGVIIEDCQKLEKFISKLDVFYQNELKSTKPNNIDELFAFLTSRLNRIRPDESAKLMQVYNILCKRILQSISVLHNKAAKNLANSSLETLQRNASLENLEIMKDKWFAFLSDYDDGFLKKLEQYGIKQSDDFESIINSLLRLTMTNGSQDSNYKELATLIVASLVPSIASSMNDELAQISKNLKSNPELLDTPAMLDDIKKFIMKRIELDKAEFKQKIIALDQILDDINNRVEVLVTSSAANSQSAKTIKRDLHDINLDKDSYQTIKTKLINIANTIDTQSSDFVEQIQSNKNTILKLQNRVNELETKLAEAQLENNEDFLTKTGNKKALEKELLRMEDTYVRYDLDYSICFFDIDHFKKINDTYGHDAGDIILATFGKILKSNVRKFDFVGRYGGEEFVAILPKITLEGAINFANKLRHKISQFKFIYKDVTISITMSCGVASRLEASSDKDTLKLADDRLYEAKQSGRNCVRPEP